MSVVRGVVWCSCFLMSSFNRSLYRRLFSRCKINRISIKYRRWIQARDLTAESSKPDDSSLTGEP